MVSFLFKYLLPPRPGSLFFPFLSPSLSLISSVISLVPSSTDFSVEGSLLDFLPDYEEPRLINTLKIDTNHPPKSVVEFRITPILLTYRLSTSSQVDAYPTRSGVTNGVMCNVTMGVICQISIIFAMDLPYDCNPDFSLSIHQMLENCSFFLYASSITPEH